MNNTASSSEAATLAAISPSRANSAVFSSPESDRNEPDTTAAQDPQQDGEAVRVSTPGSVHRQSTDASADKEHNEDSNVSQQPARPRNTVKKEENRRILPNLSRYQSPYTGNRDYDYEKKYPPDPYGEETGEDARVWKVYLDEAEAYDDEMLKGFRDTINSLLVFAALFSAVVTTFVVQTSQALLPDYGYITANLLIEQVQLLRAAGNATAINNVPRSSVDINSASFSSTDVWLNGLFFTSLALSLATALLSVLANQWLQAYTSLTSGSARERAMIRQFRFSGFKEWKMHEIIGMLPIILHLSLAVFFAGLALFVSELQHRSIYWVVVAIAAISFGIYLASVILPAIWIQCPYRIPMLFIPTQYIPFPFYTIQYILRLAYWLLLRSLARHRTFYQRSTYLEEFWRVDKPESPSFLARSLKSGELKWLEKHDNFGRVVSDAFVWLSTLKSNMSIQRITIQALHGIFTDAYSKDSARGQLTKQPFMPWNLNSASIYRTLEKLHFSIGEFVWGQYHNMDRAATDGTVGWSVRKRFEAEKALLKHSSIDHSASSYLIEAARNGDLSIVKDLMESGAESNSRNPKGETALVAASQHGHVDVVKLLIDMGADVNTVVKIQDYGEYFITALRAATRGKYVNVVELLIQHSADVNSCYPLSDAITAGELDIIKLLMQNGARVSESDGTALHVAVGTPNAKLNIVTFLLDQGADVNEQSFHDAPLQRAALWGQEAILKLLIERGANVNAEGEFYGTALQTAVYWCRLAAVKLLIAKGANMNATAGVQGTALEIAASRGQLEVVKFLLEQGADVNANGKYESATQAARASPSWVPGKTRKTIINLLRQYGATD